MIGGIENVTTYEEYKVQEAAPEHLSELGQESFLKLLVAQMQHQDPLNPQSNGEFVAQLAQFTSLEQLMGVNSTLNKLFGATASMNNASMTQLLGREVTAYSDTISYSGEGSTEVWWDATVECETMSITITDEEGSVVARKEFTGGMSAGEGSWTWDGTDTEGVQVAEGEYKVTLRGTDVNGKEVVVKGLLKGIIDQMSFETGSPVPYVDGVEITIGDIIRVHTPDEDDETT